MTRSWIAFTSTSSKVFLSLIVLHAAVGLNAQTNPAGSGAMQKSTAPTSVILVDTDEVCHLIIDDQDDGYVTPAQSRKIKVTFGQHIVKCISDSSPDIVWRQVVEAKSSQQVAAMVALKPLHNSDQAATEQPAEGPPADEKAAPPEQNTNASNPQELFGQLKGTWRRTTHDDDPNWQSDGHEAPSPSDDDQILEVVSLSGRTIVAKFTDNSKMSDGDFARHTVYSYTFHIPPPDAPTEIRMVERTVTRTSGPHPGTKSIPGGATMQQDLQINLVDSNHLELVGGWANSAGGRVVFERSR
jgi:hypothetical protein